MVKCVVILGKMPRYCYECDIRLRCPSFLTTEGKTKPMCEGCRIICSLPEGYGDLVDRNRFKDHIDQVCDAGGWLEPVTSAVRDYIKKQIDVEKAIVPADGKTENVCDYSKDTPVPRCEFRKYESGNNRFCTNCGAYLKGEEYENHTIRFCYYCGYKVKEQDENGD